jgi:tetratricopeptide (TPR) repeat protein
MRRRDVSSRAARVLALLALAGCAVGGPEKPPLTMDRDVPLDGWFVVESRHASIVSAAGERRTLELAAQLERLIGVLDGVGSVRRFETRVPATLYLFPDTTAYSYFRPEGVLGHFSESNRGFFILMGPDYETRSVLFHEYVHLLMRNQGAFEYPVWYEEGLAELLETTSFREHLISLGAVPGMRASTLRGSNALRLDQVLGARSYADVPRSLPQFYAQSWLLTHLLHLGHHAGYPRRIESLRAYLLALQTQPDWRAAFDASFPEGLDALAEDLESYRQRVVRDAYIPRIRIDARKLEDVQTGATSRAIDPASVAVELGSVYLDSGKEGAYYAQRLFERALERDPSHARARAGLARAQALHGAFDEAQAEVARAEAMAPDDAFVLRAQGAVLLLGAASREQADGGGRVEAERSAARAALRRAIELEPGAPEGHVLLGWSYLGSADDPAEGLAALGRAHALLPWNEGINLDLARLYAQSGQSERALEHVDRVLRWSHGESLEQARTLRAEIERAGAGHPGP